MATERKGGRVRDPGNGQWYRDGFAPFQLPEVLRAECGLCGGLLLIGRGGAWCARCSVKRTDDNGRQLPPWEMPR